MRRTGRHAHGAVRTGEVAEWSTSSPGANLDSEAGPERIARRASLRMRRAYAPDGPPRPRCSENRRGGRVVECAGFEIRCTVLPYRGFESHPLRHSPGIGDDVSDFGPNTATLDQSA